MKHVIKGKYIFDGEKLLTDNEIAIENGIVTEIGRSLNGSQVIDLGDAFIMPGMTDAHIHLSGAESGNLVMEYFTVDGRDRLIRTIPWLYKLLQSGFTSVRDCGEVNSIYLRNAVKDGIIKGPDISAAGMPLSQTFGHGEFSHTVPVDLSEHMGLSEICDGVEECIKSTRKVLRNGSDFIKIFSTGGVLSQKDRPDQEQFTHEEIRGIVREAEKAGTYVAAHAHGDMGARNAVEGGVKTLEHGTLVKSETLKLMARNGVSMTPTLAIQELITRHGKELGINEWGLEKIKEVREGISNVVPEAMKLGVNLLCGTDLGFYTGKDIDLGKNWMEMVLMTEICGLSNEEALRTSTGNISRIGLKQGRIMKGFPANIVSIEGNPLENIKDLGRVNHVFKKGVQVR
ncbi:MAG: amidohydrolase family protein [Thermoplasmatales archaeon]